MNRKDTFFGSAALVAAAVVMSANSAMARTVSVASENKNGYGVTTSFDLEFSAESADTTNSLWAVWGGTDGGTSSFVDWDKITYVGQVPGDVTSTNVAAPFTGMDTVQLRFFLAAADAANAAGYRLDYIQCTGAQYVMTTFTPDGNSAVEVELAFNSNPDGGGNQNIFCARGSSSTTDIFVLFWLNNKWRWDYNATQASATSQNSPGTARHKIRADYHGVVIDDALAQGTAKDTAASFTAGDVMSIFGTHGGGGSPGNFGKFKLYSFKAWQDGSDDSTLALDLVPFRKLDGTVGLYNKVDGSFLGNAVSGTPFVAGEVVGTFENFTPTASTDAQSYTSAMVFDWINATDGENMTIGAVWENDANWRGGVYPSNHVDAVGRWAMTNSVMYLTNDVPFVQTLNMTNSPEYWNGWVFGRLVSDRYHRIGGKIKAPRRRSTIYDARDYESFIVTRPDPQTYSTADHGPMLVVHKDFTNALPQWHVQNYQRISAMGDKTGGVVGAGKLFGAGLFRLGDDYGNSDDVRYGSANVEFDFGELQTGAEGHMRLMKFANATLHGRTNDAPYIVAGPALHLDASKEGTLTVSSGKVTSWSDADDGPVSATAIGSPVVGTSTNGLAVVQCPANSAFRLSSAISAREIFLVFRHLATAYNAKAPAFVGNSQGNTEFLRCATTTSYRYQGLFAGGAGAKHLEAGEVWYDGTRTLPFGLYDDFRHSLHVVSGALYDSTAPVEFIGAETESTNVGAIELAEVLIYDKELTSRERREVNSYLRAKWQTPDRSADWDLGSFSFPVNQNNHGKLTVADGRVGIREISYFATQTLFTKRGGGDLEVGRLSPERMSVQVDGGTMAFRDTEGPVRKQMAVDPSVWLDASQSDTFVRDPTNDTLVCKWNDPRGKNRNGSEIYATNGVSGTGTKTYGRSPKIVSDTPTGRTALDFGPDRSRDYWEAGTQGEAGCMKISAAPFREGFMVMKSNGGNSTTNFQTFSANSWDLFGANSSRFLNVDYCGSAACGGYWTVDGNVCDGPAHPALKADTYYVIGFKPSGYWYGSMTRLAGGRDNSDGGGGVTIAEVVYYDRILSPAERRDTEAYLMDKWLGREHPVARAQNITIPTMTFAAGVSAVLDSDVETAIGSLVGATGTLVKKGKGRVAVGAFGAGSACDAVSLADGILSLPSLEGVDTLSGEKGTLDLAAVGGSWTVANVEGTPSVTNGNLTVTGNWSLDAATIGAVVANVSGTLTFSAGSTMSVAGDLNAIRPRPRGGFLVAKAASIVGQPRMINGGGWVPVVSGGELRIAKPGFIIRIR